MMEKGSGSPERNSDNLFLQGKIQVETARDALSITGKNPETVKLLTTLLETHSLVSDKQSQNDLKISLVGDSAKRQKGDIIESLVEVQRKTDIPEDKKTVFGALHEILTKKEE